VLKKIALLIAMFYTLAITAASFITIKKLPQTGLSFQDKLFHFLAYALLAYVWYNFLSNKRLKIKNPILLAFLIATIYGILIEVLQGQLTMSRVTELYDAIANTLGALTTALVLKLRLKHVKNY